MSSNNALPVWPDSSLRHLEGLDEAEQQLLADLAGVWRDKLAGNQVKNEYYNQKNLLNDLGIAIPPRLRRVKTVIGWPAKAVDLLAARSRFNGFTFTDRQGASSEFEEVLKANELKQSYKEALVSELTNSVSFFTVTAGDGGAGEPPVIIMPYTAVNASALWDFRRRRLKAGMTIVDVDKQTGQPVALNLFTDKDVIEIARDGPYSWGVAARHAHIMGRPLMEPLRNQPSIDRPFGKSRITDAVISITDSAVRASLRAEISAEFYTTPQRYVLGADDSAFEKDKWATYITSLALFGKDEDGDVPSYGQLPQMTMQPHLDYMRSLAAQFAGETGIPISSLGIIQDNPSSAEAIHSAREDLIIAAQDLNDTNGVALRNIGLMALAVMRGVALTGLSPNELTMEARFKNPANPSVVSQSDAIVKQAAVVTGLGDTEVALEELGYTAEQIARIKSETRRAQAASSLAERLDNAEPGPS